MPTVKIELLSTASAATLTETVTATNPILGTSNLTFTAAWIQLYEVTYIPNGGTFAGGDTNKDSECPLSLRTRSWNSQRARKLMP